MGKALYRKYRSRKLSEIVGQEHVTTLLENALKLDRVAHAYLFTGPKGVGKTSIARILAHEINELPYSDDSNHLDIIEIDAASNNGVDDIRDLRERVNLAPTSAKKKIYIIDEVHMLSKPAFNALLKTLEEPPEHVVFILATTDIDKLPETIVSRTQRHTFKRASISHIVENLKKISKKEKISIDDEALGLIAEHADGSYRDSVSLLDQLANVSDGKKISSSMIEESLGLAPKKVIIELAEAVARKDFSLTIKILSDLDANGIQASITAKQLTQHILLHVSSAPQLLSLIDDLLEVSRSSMPGAALIACLGSYTAPNRSAPVAASVQAPTILKELEAKATELHPKDDIITKKKTPAIEKPLAKSVDKHPKSKESFAEIDWQKLVQAARETSIGLSTVLLKCNGVTDGTTITIYTRNPFYQKKLSAAPYQQILHKLLVEQSGQDWEIILIPAALPSKDSQVNAVAAIMGGGEEVEFEE
jgi:DNA polymerase-3 subunit gamma/tau